MTTTETTVGTLSAEDVAALRLAHSVTFHHYEGRAFIRIYVRPSGHPATLTVREQLLFPERDSVVSPDERSRVIEVTGSISGYHENGTMWHVDSGDTRARAFEMVHSAQYASTWTTIASLLSAGESVWLHWIADNHTDLVREHGLHADELQLVATKGKRTRTFSVARTITLDNSARMIHRHG